MKTCSREKIISGIYLVFVLMLLVLALGISSTKVKLVFGALAVGIFVVSKFFGKFQSLLLTAAVSVFILLNLFYNVKNLNIVNPMTKIKTQTLYQTDNYEAQSYPDSFMRLLVQDKTVLLPSGVKLYSEYGSYGKENLEGNIFSNHYLIDNNYVRYFATFAKEVSTNEGLPDNRDFAIGEHAKDFETLGIGNDLLRYSFLLNEEGIQEATYFWYSWYYYSFANDEQYYPSVNIRAEGLVEDDCLVALWDSEENLYLMSEQYYREVIADEYE